MGRLFDRMLAKAGLVRVGAVQESFKAATRSRLNADWAISILSADQDIRGSLTAMRRRSRTLGMNNDYASRFLNKSKENVIGPNGIGLQMLLDPKLVLNAAAINSRIESAWLRFCDRPTVDGRMTIVDSAQLWIASKMQDGETFVRKVKGFPFSRSRFAIDFIDPDAVDVSYQQRRGSGNSANEIRLGVEVDQWRRPVAYYVYDGHPGEMAGVKRVRVPAEQIEHSFVFKRINQTRGIPWMHTAMSRMHMLGGYEEAELVAARLAACKMGYFVSKIGEDFHTEKNPETGAYETEATPGSLEILPEGFEPKVIDWQHPNQIFPEFVRAMLRGASMGLNVSYSTLAGDLREVNFSSLRQGVLDEREGWRVLQTFARDHFYKPVFKEWLGMAILAGDLDIPSQIPLELVLESAAWTPRGWDWVDPSKDVSADTAAIRSGQTTLQDTAAKRGKDWRDIIDQRAVEIEYARSKGVPIDLSTAGVAVQDPEDPQQGNGRQGNE